MRTDESRREALIREYFPLVKAIARRVRHLVPSMDIDDLIGDGSIGLIRAVDAFDPNRGPSLTQYARCLIVGAMLNGIRRMDPVPERARRVMREGENERYRLAVERGTLPSRTELELIRPGHARATEISRRSLPLSLDAALPQGETISPDASADPSVIVADRHTRDEIHRRIDALSPRQRAVLYGHYFADRSLRSIGKRMSISAQRASQLHTSALARLRKVYHAAPH